MDAKCTPVIITRFLGTTPDSSSIYPLIKSICYQMSHIYEKPLEAIPTELSNLTNYFKKLLECATSEKPVFIFLDSLDSLSPMNSAHSLSWMPVNLPKNVKIILSTLSGYYGITQTLHNMIEIPENFAKISSKNIENVDTIDQWIYHRLDSRYCIKKSYILDIDNKLIEVLEIGIEDPKELSMFTLGCPYIQ